MQIDLLEKKLKQLDVTLQAIVSKQYATEMLTIIHRPGWTTPQEAQLVHALVESLQHQVDGVQRTHELLLEAADRIGKT
jgi:predicted nucleic acid-binding protein